MEMNRRQGLAAVLAGRRLGGDAPANAAMPGAMPYQPGRPIAPPDFGPDRRPPGQPPGQPPVQAGPGFLERNAMGQVDPETRMPIGPAAASPEPQRMVPPGPPMQISPPGIANAPAPPMPVARPPEAPRAPIQAMGQNAPLGAGGDMPQQPPPPTFADRFNAAPPAQPPGIPAQYSQLLMQNQPPPDPTLGLTPELLARLGIDPNDPRIPSNGAAPGAVPNPYG